MPDRLNEVLATWSTRRIMSATIVVLSVLLAAYILIEISIILILVFVAFLLSAAVRPMVAQLQRINIPPALGVIITYLLLLAAIVGIGVLVVPLVANQVSAISGKIPEYYDDARGMMMRSGSAVIRSISLRLPVEPPFEFDSGMAEANADDPAVAVAQLISLAGSAGKVLFVIFGTLLLGFYWTLDSERIVRALLKFVPEAKREGTRDVIAEMQQTLGAYIRGQLLLNLSVGVLATIGYFAIGLDYAVVLGILAGVMETVPILGPILGAVPAALIALASGDTTALIWVIVLTVAIQQVEGAVLVPRIMDRAVGVNAVVTLLAFAAFTSLLGLVGGLLAVPLAAIGQIIFNRLVFSLPEGKPIERRDRLGVLRYETQQLLQSIRQHLRKGPKEGGPPDDEQVAEAEDELEALVEDLDRLIVQASQDSEARL